MRRLLSLLVLLAPVWALPAQAQQSTLPERIEVPFDPPVGQTMRYRLTQTFFGTDGPTGSESEQTLTFEPNSSSGGYSLTVRDPEMPDSSYTFGPDGRMQRLSSIQDVAALFAPVVSVETDSNGRFLRVRNWEQFRENLRRMPELALQAVPDELTRQRIRAIMGEMPDPAATLTAESAAGAAVPLWSKIFGFGGLEVIAGQPREWSNKREFLDGAATLESEFSLLLEPTSDGNWTFHFQRTETPKGFADAVESVMNGEDQTKIAEARRLAVNSNWMRRVVDTRILDLTLDRRGMVVDGTYDARARTPSGIEAGTTLRIVKIN